MRKISLLIIISLLFLTKSNAQYINRLYVHNSLSVTVYYRVYYSVPNTSPSFPCQIDGISEWLAIPPNGDAEYHAYEGAGNPNPIPGVPPLRTIVRILIIDRPISCGTGANITLNDINCGSPQINGLPIMYDLSCNPTSHLVATLTQTTTIAYLNFHL